jgi:hypothetical protein
MIISKKLTVDRLEEIKRFPISYDEDCPKLTPEKLDRMKPRYPVYVAEDSGHDTAMCAVTAY